MSEPRRTSLEDEATPSAVDGQPEIDTSAEPLEGLHDDAPATGRAVQGMIPGRSRRRTRLERVSMRTLATGGIIGIDTGLGALLVSNDEAGWIVGLAVGLTSVTLAAVLWSSRQL